MSQSTARRPVIVVSIPDLYRDRFLSPSAVARLEAAGTVLYDPEPFTHESEESRAILAQAEVLVTGWETGNIDGLLDQMPDLRLIAHTGGSVRHIAGPGIYERGIRVTTQTELNAVPVAEYTLAMIILAAKDIFASARAYNEGRAKGDDFWFAFPNIGLYGAQIGLIGLSRISRLVINYLKPFNVNIKVFSRHLSDEQAAAMGVTSASIMEIMETCDVVSLHSASTPATYHMLGAEHFAAMKDGATFINTARGAICDQDALIEELKRDRIRAIIDVTDPEVPEPDSALWDLPNLVLTPHAAGSMGRELFSLGDGAVSDMEIFLAGGEMAGELVASQYEGRA